MEDTKMTKDINIAQITSDTNMADYNYHYDKAMSQYATPDALEKYTYPAETDYNFDLSYDFSDQILGWFRKIPEGIVLLSGVLDAPSGFNMWCRLAAAGFGSFIGYHMGGNPTIIASAGRVGITVFRPYCDKKELEEMSSRICAKFNELNCPRNKFDVKQVRHPAISIRTDSFEGEKVTLLPLECPPCSENKANKFKDWLKIFTYKNKQIEAPSFVPDDTYIDIKEPQGSILELCPDPETRLNCVQIPYSDPSLPRDIIETPFILGQTRAESLVAPYITERIPDFALPSGSVNQQCADLNAIAQNSIADLEKVLYEKQSTDLDLIDDVNVTEAICKLLQTQESIPLGCLPPKLTLGQIVNFDADRC